MNGMKRMVLGAAALCAAGMALPAAALDDARLRLNWMYYGSHAGFALGKDSGGYRDAGINLDIRSGNGSSSAHRLVANGDSDFAYGSCVAMVTLAAQGAPLVSVGVIDANVPDGALVSSYLQGAGGAVAILGGLDDKPAEIKANGGDTPVTFAYSDFGVNQVGYCLSTHRKTVEERPDLVKRFVTATMQAYAEAETNPDAAVAAIADIVGGTMAEDQGKEQARAVLDVTLSILYSNSNTERKLGMHVASDWDDMLSLMKDFNDLETDLPASAFYTNDFLP